MKSTFLSLIFVLLQVTLWFDANGVSSLNQRIQLEQKDHSQLLASVQQLQHRINQFKQPMQSSLVEDHIRWKLGLIKKGEWFCRW